MRPRSSLLFLALLTAPAAGADLVVDFDDLGLAPNSHWNGPDPTGTTVSGPYGDIRLGQFSSHGASFVNRYDLTYGSWNGFAYSTETDTTSASYLNQFSAITGDGHGSGSGVDAYGVAFGYNDVLPNMFDDDPFDPSDPTDLMGLPSITLPTGTQALGMFVTNTTYAALSMLRGDSFAKKFGGATGNDQDWFKLSAYGTDALGNSLGLGLDFYLADYRFADNSLDYIVNDWAFFDLSPLAGATRLHFNLFSSDNGDFGMNTPAYFAMDDLYLRSSTAVPEPSTLALAGLGAAGVALLAHRRHRAA